MDPQDHHHHHSLFTRCVLIYNSVMNNVIRRSYRKKNRNSRNTWHSEKTRYMYSLGQPWGFHDPAHATSPSWPWGFQLTHYRPLGSGLDNNIRWFCHCRWVHMRKHPLSLSILAGNCKRETLLDTSCRRLQSFSEYLIPISKIQLVF